MKVKFYLALGMVDISKSSCNVSESEFMDNQSYRGF